MPLAAIAGFPHGRIDQLFELVRLVLRRDFKG
jgi:hypothetical protein